MPILFILGILINLLIFSVGVNVYFYRQLKRLKSNRPESVELQEFLGDLMGGRALIQVKRIDPASVFLHSPRRLE